MARTGRRAVYSTWPTCCPPLASVGHGGDGAGDGRGAGAPGERGGPVGARLSSRPGQRKDEVSTTASTRSAATGAGLSTILFCERLRGLSPEKSLCSTLKGYISWIPALKIELRMTRIVFS
ncbi:hypothetical protein PoB_001718000 [Plakobranchus ocellatus]|uniref:Uncharacterized protein n=1 Tax=Plakobranchus ocellatus TaxID=259542 RepID=A0AAV3Z6B4_9GAST|nr:hypothetical protein PoB_001718000 [Plakobranchus ocellatus]